MLVVFLLRLGSTVTEESVEYDNIKRANDAINRLPGIEGKIAVGLQPTGHGKFSQSELNDEVGIQEDRSCGFTHVCSVWVDNPESFKMLAASKTWGKWKAAYEPHLSKVRNVAPPLTATAAAPKKEKKNPARRR